MQLIVQFWHLLRSMNSYTYAGVAPPRPSQSKKWKTGTGRNLPEMSAANHRAPGQHIAGVEVSGSTLNILLKVFYYLFSKCKKKIVNPACNLASLYLPVCSASAESFSFTLFPAIHVFYTTPPFYGMKTMRGRCSVIMT